MSDLDQLIQRLTTGPGPRSEHHSASDGAGLVTLETGPETRVHLSAATGLDAGTRELLAKAIAEALDTLLEQDSPFARSLVDELQPHVGFAEVQHRLLGQATAWKERSSALQARLARARDRQP